MDYGAIIEAVYSEVNELADPGQVARYIPELARVDADRFAVFMVSLNQTDVGCGQFNERFSIQSIAKVLSLTMAYQILGPELWRRVGVEPSGTPFNSLLQLEADKGIPRNPFINAGALVICDILISHLDNAKNEFLSFVRLLSDIKNLEYSKHILESERHVGFRNIALCHFLKDLGNIRNDPVDVLDFYFSMCSLEMNCRELASTFTFLANGGQRINDGQVILNLSQTKRINALMQTCGFYDESGEFAFTVGLPGKSGVGGGIIAVYPGQYTVAVWSPKLNKKGNSYKGMKFLEAFTTATQSSIF